MDGKVYLVNTSPKDLMISHSVLPGDTIYDTPNRTFSQGDTILVSNGFVNDTRNSIGLYTSDRSNLTDRQARAIIIIHEIIHLYTGQGHPAGLDLIEAAKQGKDPKDVPMKQLPGAGNDWVWNDYIYSTCIQDIPINWKMGI